MHNDNFIIVSTIHRIQNMSCKHKEERKKRNCNTNFHSTNNKSLQKRKEIKKEECRGWNDLFELEKTMKSHVRSPSLTQKHQNNTKNLLVNVMIPMLESITNQQTKLKSKKDKSIQHKKPFLSNPRAYHTLPILMDIRMTRTLKQVTQSL